MRKHTVLLAAVAALVPASFVAARPQAATSVAAPSVADQFTYTRVMVPMHDGAKMETVIIAPKGAKTKLPILFQRTPYGVPGGLPTQVPANWKPLVADGYIFVFQSMRGRFGSDGKFTLSTSVKTTPNEATDAYDAIDWLVKNVPNNNGKVGMWGVSYPGFAAAVALAKPHPALKAVSPQAAWIDYWLSDDLHRNGALRLSYATEWVSSLQVDKTQNKELSLDGMTDAYDWYLKMGPVENIDKTIFKGAAPMFTSLLDHPNHDAFYTDQNWQTSLGKTTVPTLNVAGFWDQEDPWGSWQIYAQQTKNDPDHLAQIVAGPWNHGGWQGKGSTLGAIPIGTESGTEFQTQVQAPFFAYWLHGKGARPDFTARMFQSGSNVWKTYAAWPPAGAKPTDLYFHADGSLSFTAPAAGEGCRDYVSDPANPVPFRKRPMSRTYATPDWRLWESDDQRFVDHRPDVLSYVSAPLDNDVTVTGAIAAKLMASTSGTDSDFVVKLIDVLPDNYVDTSTTNWGLGDYAKTLNGYQWPIAMDVRRGRFLASDTKPQALVPDKVIAWDVPLRDHDHVFKKGHRIMVQVQSTWFPVIDRNPQTFVPNIMRAKASDFVKATQRVCSGSKIVLPVM
ncbi:CocE/NonD family hydrolase [Sphingomonas panacisoli]|uniref:CocE/NonD family hydrolase n=1 Tax=Sphingomonas panacisoli TaxID=1813879 RepID=A0A5B8LKE0_9SPHN|nr:CocE/NonD family hydrolase [Sphingomonas panacisoli]QDZ08205.1 CocE/NonD family hydrolase [Sphingomonas panacisoli]